MDTSSEHRVAVRLAGALGVLCVLFSAFLLLVGPLAGSAHAQDSNLIKVYVVRSQAQNGGVAETLPEIAQRTLGNPARASDILQLNEGRQQADGGALTGLDQTLHPGWILRLPPDASGAFVQFGQDTGATKSIFSIPIVLAVLGGVLLLGLTLLILFRRKAMAGVRRIVEAGHRLLAPVRRRKARQRRVTLAGQWHADPNSTMAAGVALAQVGRSVAGSVAGPMAVDLFREGVRVFPAPPQQPPAPWQADGPLRWTRPHVFGPAGDVDPRCRPILIGGDTAFQSFVDLSYCDGALAVAGDERTAVEVQSAVMSDVATHHVDVRVAWLGESPAGNHLRFNHSGELASLLNLTTSPFDAPIMAAARRRPVTGVIAVSATVPFTEKAQVARMCSTPGSTWIAVITGDVPGAHWRWDAHRDGTLRVPLLNRTVVATL